jgi:hypothetical protein
MTVFNLTPFFGVVNAWPHLQFAWQRCARTSQMDLTCELPSLLCLMLLAGRCVSQSVRSQQGTRCQLTRLSADAYVAAATLISLHCGEFHLGSYWERLAVYWTGGDAQPARSAKSKQAITSALLIIRGASLATLLRFTVRCSVDTIRRAPHRQPPPG